MTTGVEKSPPAMLWTPWGGQRILQPGEKFTALRRAVKKLRAERKAAALRKQPAN